MIEAEIATGSGAPVDPGTTEKGMLVRSHETPGRAVER